jgi:multiple sugar transport system substrate-binding protein
MGYRILLILIGLALSQPCFAQGKLELEFPTWQAEEPGYAEFWTEAVKAFEQSHPNVKINKYQVPFREFIDKMTVRFAAGNPPQVAHLPTRNLPSFAAQGWLMPLDDLIAKTDIRATYTKMAEEMVWNGKTQGVLLMGYGMMFFYNERILKEAGVAVPTTEEELLKAIQAATNVNKGLFGWGTTTTDHPQIYVDWASWATGLGVSFYKEHQYSFTDPAVVRAIDRFRVAAKHAPKGTSTEAMRQLFVDGKIAMLRDGPWVGAMLKKAPEDVRPFLKMGLLPFPHNPGGTSNSIHIPAKIDPERKQLVWEFIQLLTIPEWQAKYMLLTRSPAPRRNALSERQQAEQPELTLVAKSVSSAVNLFPEIPAARTNYNQIAKLVGEAGIRLVNSDRPTADILKDLQAELVRRVPLK